MPLSRSSSADFIDSNQIEFFHSPSWVISGQLGAFVVAGRDGEDAGTDRFGAFDVARSITDDEDVVASELVAEEFFGALAGNRRKAIAIFVIVAEAAGHKLVPEIVMGKF